MTLPNRFKRKYFYLAWTLLLASMSAPAVCGQAAPPTTAVTDTIYRADGTAATGTVLIGWPAFTLATGASIPSGTKSVTLGAGGALNVNLVANAGAIPMGSYYTVVYHLDDGSVTREYWVVPAAPATVPLAAIRSTVLPASVALQTVTKAYVDTAILAALLSHPPGTATPSVAATTGPAGLPQRAALLGEYLMNEGSGTTVHDTSGAGNDATFGIGDASPVWEGRQDLDFQNGPYLSLPQALNAAQTWMFLAYFPVDGAQPSPQAPGYFHPDGYPSILCGTTNRQMCLITSLSLRSRSYTFEAFNTDSTAAGEFMPPGWHTVTLTCGNSAGAARLFYDGAEVGSYGKRGNNTCPVATIGNYQIGGSSTYLDTFFAGKMAGVWAWKTALSPAEATTAARSALGYLDAKGISRAFRKLVQPAPQILAGLDSRTAGYLLTPATVWPALMNLTDAAYVRTNVAVSGQQAIDTCNEFDLAYASQAGEGSGPVITVLWGGINDLRSTGQTARQIAASLRCSVLQARQIGRVVLATEISSNGGSPGNGTADAGKNALDTILRAEAFQWGVDNLADLATDPLLGADGASASTTYFFDGLHPTLGGQQRVAAVMQNAVNELLGASETARHQTAAAAYQELAGDRFLDLTGSASQTVTLPDCTGYSLPRQVVNLGASAATVATANSQTLLGAVAIAPNTRAVFLPVPGAPATGGCTWERTQ